MNERETAACLQLVNHFTGCDLKNEFLCRAVISNIRRRLQSLKITKLSRYIGRLAEDPEEFLLFLSNATIHTTFWFREEKHFELLRKEILRLGLRRVDINCLACSSGEEAYSLSFVLEDMVAAGEIDGYAIDASDIDLCSVHKASRGRYNVNGINRFIRDFSQYYRIEGQEFEVCERLREKIRFERQNLLELPERSDRKYDFVLCRNVLIYFDFLSIKKIMLRVAARLKDHGVFVVGHCESLDLGKQDQFTLVTNSMYVRTAARPEQERRRRRKRVLCVDDSESMLKLLSHRLEKDFDVLTASGPAAADAIIAQDTVDHIILDINMPEKAGDDYLRELRQRRITTPVLLLSEVSQEEADRVVGSLFQENVDFLNKSSADRNTLFHKLSLSSYAPRRYANNFDIAQITDYHVDALLVGGSTGAIPVIRELLSSVRRPHVPIVVIEHMEPHFLPRFATTVSQYLGSPLVEPAEPVMLEAGHLYMAQRQAHVLVCEERGRPMLRYGRSTDAPVDGHIPSITRLFASAAQTPFRFAAFLLTGMGRDGAQGLLELRQHGSLTFTQDEASSVVYGMPKVAADLKANMHSGNPRELAEVFRTLAENVEIRPQRVSA